MAITEKLCSQIDKLGSTLSASHGELSELARGAQQLKEEYDIRAKKAYHDLDKKFCEEEKRIRNEYKSRMEGIRQLRASITSLKGRMPSNSVDTYNELIKDPAVLAEIRSALPSQAEVESIQAKIGDQSMIGTIKKWLSLGGYKRQGLMVKEAMLMLENGFFYVDRQVSACEKELADALAKLNDEKAKKRVMLDKKLATEKIETLRSIDVNTSQQESVRTKVAHNPLIKEVNDSVQGALASLSLSGKRWGTYKSSAELPKEIAMGCVAYPLSVPAVLATYINPQTVPTAFINPVSKELSFPVPYAFSFFRSPMRVYIKYNAEDKGLVAEGIQSFLSKIIDNVPAGRFDITFIDPVDRGSNLGLLQQLIGLPGGKIFNPIATSKEDIALSLRSVQDDIDRMSQTLGNIPTMYHYNKLSDDAKMLHHIVVIHDFPKNFTQAAVDALEVIFNNADKCGVSIILLQSMQSEPISQELARILEKELKRGTFTIIEPGKKHYVAILKGKPYMFKFDGMSQVTDSYIQSVKVGFDTRIKVDNTYSTRVLDSALATFRINARSLAVPFAVDQKNQLKELIIGSSVVAHSMIAGKNGSGKSTALHTIINGLMNFYSPSDVNLWLIDYNKVEFAKYKSLHTAHIKLIGLENSPEFTYGLLDKVNAEAKIRTDLLEQAGVASINDYNAKVPVEQHIPRLVIIIDEFHNMSNHIYDESKQSASGVSYKILLENLLREVRKLGISFFFSDQSASEGLRGFTSVARNQLHNRFAMMSDNQNDISEALGLNSGIYSDEQKQKVRGSMLVVGDVLFSEIQVDPDDDTKRRVVVEQYRVLKSEDADRERIVVAVNSSVVNSTSSEPMIVESSDRKHFEPTEIVTFEKAHPVISTRIAYPLYLGTPASLESCFRIVVERASSNNVILAGSDDDLRFSSIYYSMRSYLRSDGTHIICWIDRTEPLYSQYAHMLEEIHQHYPDRVRLLYSIQDICDSVFDLKSKIEAGTVEPTFVYGLGFESFLDDFSVLPAVRSQNIGGRNNTNTVLPKEQYASSSSDVMALLMQSVSEELKAIETEYADVLGGWVAESDPIKSGIDEAVDTRYDCRSDIRYISAQGPKYGCFLFVVFDTATGVNKARNAIDLNYFNHRLITKMGRDASLSFINNPTMAAKLDRKTMIYSNGGSENYTFRPYLLN